MRNKSGFTIVEMLLYMGLLTIFLFILTEIFTSVTNLQLESQSTSSVQQDGRFVLARLSYDIKRAEAYYNPPSATTPTPAILLPTGIGYSNSQLRIVIGGVVYTYGIDAVTGNLTVNDSTTTENLNGYDTSISQIGSTPIFQRFGNTNGKNSISINFKVTSRSRQPGKGSEIKNYSTTVSTR